MPTPSLPLGKTRGLRRLASESGHFITVALDQRPPIARMLAARLGIPESRVAFDDMLAAKRLLVEVLGPCASAMLLDPDFALPAALPWLPPRTGLIVTLEDHRYRDTPGGRLSHSIPNWSVGKIKRAGADAVKVLVWYRPDAAADVRAHQQAYVRQVGLECRRHDIAFVLELLDYPFQGTGAPDEAAGAGTDLQRAQRVIDSVGEFAGHPYGVDLFKLESPLPGSKLPQPDGEPAHLAAQKWFDDMGAICREAAVPWVMLSAGVTPAQFLRVMQYACGAGANGFLAGRAIWAEALQAYPDLAACRGVLRARGLQTLRDLTELTRNAAQAWRPDYSALAAIRAEGELSDAYPGPHDDDPAGISPTAPLALSSASATSATPAPAPGTR